MLGQVRTTLASLATAIPDAQYVYEPFGQTTVSGLTDNRLAFTGRRSDQGLSYFRSRFYDPMTGRFLSEDPLQFVAGTNFYVYADDSPVNWTDPLGLWTKAQCDAAKEVLRREEKYGTRQAARMSSITYGDRTLEPFNSSHSDVHNVPSVYGPGQVDWFADIDATVLPLAGLAVPTYVGGKLLWTGGRILNGARTGNAWPFQDPAETNAATAVMSGCTFKDLFNQKLLCKECCGK